MAIKTRTVEHNHEGTSLHGFFAYDDSAAQPLPAILIAHSWVGRDQLFCDKAIELAEAGYAAFVLDVYGEAKTGADSNECASLMRPFMENRLLLQERMLHTLETLKNLPEVDENRIAAMGYCFGGLCVLDLARTGADLRGVVTFHSLFTPPGNTKGNRIKAKILIHHGFDDPMATPEDALAIGHELTEAGADWQIHLYGNTVHAFTNPSANDPSLGLAYNVLADRRSSQSLQNFLTEVLN